MSDERQEQKRRDVIALLKAHMQHQTGQEVTDDQALSWLYRMDPLDVFVAGAHSAAWEMVTEWEARKKWRALKRKYETEYADK